MQCSSDSQQVVDDSSSDSGSSSEPAVDSDYEGPSFSPLTSDFDPSPASDSDFDQTEELHQSNILVDHEESAHQDSIESEPNDVILSQAKEQHFSFKLVGDNVDKTVRRRYIRYDLEGTLSLHYFHTYAICDRISNLEMMLVTIEIILVTIEMMLVQPWRYSIIYWNDASNHGDDMCEQLWR